MEGLTSFCPLVDYVADITAPCAFVLVDIGIGRGIDRQWRRFGRRLRAIGFDPPVKEIERLIAAEKNPNVKYVNAFASLPQDHPFVQKARLSPIGARNPWPRLSACRYLEQVYPATQQICDQERLAANLWPTAELAPSEKSIVVPEFLRQGGIDNVDFLKIDVDGKDFEILNSFDDVFADFGILSIGIEVNFFGSDCETANTFHNVDRYLKARGFELFHLTTRHYSTAALPSKFLYREPGPTEFGRVLQGDAMYARDLASRLYTGFAAALSADKILNLAAIFALFNLPDCAAETVQSFRSKLSSLCDVDQVLDLLAEQANKTVLGGGDYRKYVTRFAEGPRSLLRTRNKLVRVGQIIKKAYLERRARRQLCRLEGSRR